jgi:hypothetical protein
MASDRDGPARAIGEQNGEEEEECFLVECFVVAIVENFGGGFVGGKEATKEALNGV